MGKKYGRKLAHNILNHKPKSLPIDFLPILMGVAHRIFVVLEQIEINQTHFFLEGGNIPEGEQIQIP